MKGQLIKLFKACKQQGMKDLREESIREIWNIHNDWSADRNKYNFFLGAVKPFLLKGKYSSKPYIIDWDKVHKLLPEIDSGAKK